jgi:DNA adenine methylase
MTLRKTQSLETTNPAAPTRALLRYFGGKWAIAPWVLAHLPAHRIYCEPYGGAASILLRKPRSKIEVYNDLDEEIVGIFRVVQDPVTCRALMRRLRRTPYARGEFERAFAASSDPVVRAQRAITRSFMAFHPDALLNPRNKSFSHARYLSGGTSMAREWMTYPRSLVAICQRLQGAIIEYCPALNVIGTEDADDTLFFIDPPYLHATRSGGAFYRHEMIKADHRAMLERLRSVKGLVVLAGYASELYDHALHDWRRITRPHHAAGSRKPCIEMLWINPGAAQSLCLA